MIKKYHLLIITLATIGLTACGTKTQTETSKKETSQESAAPEESSDHTHDEVALGTFDIEGISVEAAQGHGAVEPGKEGHLVIKLPYNDQGASTVRVWIGTEDRTMSSVGKGEYAPSHDDYDIHAVAPDPLPEGAQWWVEIEKPEGTKAVGSVPFLKNK